MKIGSLCTGYGGLDLAAEAYYGAETIWCSEIDKYASQVIRERFNVPNLGDLKVIDWSKVEPVDILTAGYPCQPFSHAGYRKGTDDPRHIFPYILEAISILRPKRVILENVKGHLTLGFKEVLEGLTKIGYDTRWQIIRAADVGAPHHRARLFIIAQPSNTNGIGSGMGELQTTQRNQRQSQFESCQCCEITTNTFSKRCEDELCCKKSDEFNQVPVSDSQHIDSKHYWQMQGLGRRFATRCEMRLQRPPNALDLEGRLNALFVEYMMGLPVGWVTDLDISRSQQLKMLGNGVVPQQAYRALQVLDVM
jgi:DNA (cytosine-5)-methyltransferase 1